MYTKPEDAADAVRKLNDYQIRRGCKIGVVPSKDNCRLFVGRIPRDKSKEDVLEAMKDATAGVVDVIIHQDHMDPTQNRGYAFVEYEVSWIYSFFSIYNVVEPPEPQRRRHGAKEFVAWNHVGMGL